MATPTTTNMTTTLPSTSTTVDPEHITKMEIAFVCETMSVCMHVFMIGAFFYLLREAQRKAKEKSRITGSRPRELAPRTVFLGANVLVMGFLYTFGIFIENSLAKNCTAKWVNYNESFWFVGHRTSLLAVYLDRLVFIFKGSGMAYPDWYYMGLAVWIGCWAVYTIFTLWFFLGVGDMEISYKTGVNGKTMCSWDMQHPAIFYGSRLPEIVLTCVLFFSFLYKLLQLFQLIEPRRFSVDDRPPKMANDGCIAPATAENTEADMKKQKEADGAVVVWSKDDRKKMAVGGAIELATNPSTNPSSNASTLTPQLSHVASPSLTGSTFPSITLSTTPTVSDLYDPVTGDGGRDLALPTEDAKDDDGDDDGEHKTKKLGSIARLRRHARRKSKKKAHNTHTFQIVFRRVFVSTATAILSSFLIILAYQFYVPLSGFVALDAALNSFCVMTMFKFCQFLVSPVFGVKCDRILCLKFLGGGHCNCRVLGYN